MDYIEILGRWLEAARSEAGAREQREREGFDVGVLTPDDLVAVRVDLDGILDSARDVRDLLKELPDQPPSSSSLEDALIELESNLEHAMYHWDDLVTGLRVRELWPTADDLGWYRRPDQMPDDKGQERA